MSLEFIGIVNGLVFAALLYAVPFTLFGLWLFPKLSQQFSRDKTYPLPLTIVGILAVALTWYALFWFVLLSTERTLVPWDMFGQPPPSTWERYVNNFFNNPPGLVLPALLVVGASVWLFGARFRRAIDYAAQFRLFLIFTASNLIFLAVSLLLIVPLRTLPDWWLPQPRPPIDVGYHRTWLDLLGAIMLVLALLLVQAKGTKPERKY